MKNKLKQIFIENNIEILEYEGLKGKIKYRCLDCGKIYEYKCARNLFSKITLCKNCFNPFSRWNKERLEEYKLKRLYPNSDLTFIEFNGLRKSGKIKCNKCGKIEVYQNLEPIFCGRYDNFCMSCEKESNKIYNNMIEKLKNGKIKLLEWRGVNNKSKFQCLRCGNIFEKNVSSKFNPDICPNCFKVHNQFSIEDAQKKLDNKTMEKYIILQYTGSEKRSLIKHEKCGFIYSARLSDFEKTKGCPKCYKKFSLLEQKVASYLEKHNYYFEQRKRYSDLPRFSFDFLIKINDKTLLLEVQGQQHYKEIEIFDNLKKQKERDNIKREYCLVNNIPLIEIPYWEINNLEKFLQLKFNDYLGRE